MQKVVSFDIQDREAESFKQILQRVAEAKYPDIEMLYPLKLTFLRLSR